MSDVSYDCPRCGCTVREREPLWGKIPCPSCGVLLEWEFDENEEDDVFWWLKEVKH